MTLAERIEKFNNLMGDIVPPEVKKDLLEKGFFTAPASTKRTYASVPAVLKEQVKEMLIDLELEDLITE